MKYLIMFTFLAGCCESGITSKQLDECYMGVEGKKCETTECLLGEALKTLYSHSEAKKNCVIFLKDYNEDKRRLK